MSGPTTIIIGQSIRAGCEDDYLQWQKKLTAKASCYPGYLSSEVTPPTGQQADWTAVYRFDSVANAQQWLDSSSRQDLLDRAAPMFVGPGTRQILSEGHEASDALVTALVTHRIPEDKADEFLTWCAALTESERKFPGFRGAEIFRPIDGAQGEWNISIKFDTAEHLDVWLTSEERREALRSAPFGDFSLRRIDHSFGNWFSLSDRAASPPSDFKSAIAVWMGLYPTVTFLTLLTSPLRMPLWGALLVGNLLSSFVMSYLTMPFYTNRILKWWLRPKPGAPQPRTNLLGVATVLVVNAVWAAIIGLITTRIWHLP